MAYRYLRQRRVKVATVYPESIEIATSQLIGSLLVFGLALGGLAIGYSSVAIQWAVTSVLALIGLFLTVAGLWTLIRKR
ncbi:hypothetical protein [Dehalogenimonas etheniformans]|uniref:Uncharacterized protein n=1 Tax=Dehalogenimonas etheniformans TaxID=1536648 RepID=A0A2P5P968_9CHLR|nr:hypothetical protein [Dehalogenimonas etheniformans]PPD58839.1 hypothetical protein JP09_002925 [Dehalogenimonas etheniformans]QNT76391.1 hypothetical protein HX448_06700 [Dehalogenimonas etheniformans]